MDTFMPDGALKALQEANARYYHLEPGDGTRYEFIVGYFGTHLQDEFFCMGVGGAKFPYVIFDGQDIRDYIERHPKWDGGVGARSCIVNKEEGSAIDFFIEACMIDTQVNPWTVIAAVMAVNNFMNL